MAIPGDKWWPKTAKLDGDKIVNGFYVMYRTNVMRAEKLTVALLGVETMPRLETDALSMVERLR